MHGKFDQSEETFFCLFLVKKKYSYQPNNLEPTGQFMFAEFLNLFQSHHVGQLQVSKEGFFWVVILKNILRRTQWDPTVLVIWQWWYRSSSTFGKKIHVLFIFGSNNGAVLRKKNYVITLRLQLVNEILAVHRSVKNPISTRSWSY